MPSQECGIKWMERWLCDICNGNTRQLKLQNVQFNEKWEKWIHYIERKHHLHKWIMGTLEN